MKSPSSPSVQSRRYERHSHHKATALRALLAVAGATIFTLGASTATETSGASSDQPYEHAFDSEVEFEPVDFQPLDADDQSVEEDSTADSMDSSASTLDPPEQPLAEGSDESSDATAPFFYENCDAARAAGADPVFEGDRGFGPHLDRDDDGIGCEVPGANAQPPADTSDAPAPFFYENCDAARAAGAAPVQANDRGFGPHLDEDGDGIGCE